jgi:hypothetical protein
MTSTTALEGSTEAEQFSSGKTLTANLLTQMKATVPEPFPVMPHEEMLQPSGD